MKITYKTVFIAILSLLLLFSSVFPAFADVASGKGMTRISRWVNGKAAHEDGWFIYDTWAVDDTDISEYKYVLLNQEGKEAMRVEKYPEDITNGGEEHTLSSYDVELTLKPPKGVKSEIILTLENKNALYYVYFNEETDYKTTTSILSGEYIVSFVDVVTDAKGIYGLKDDFKLKVTDKAVKDKLEVVRINSDSKKVDEEDKNSKKGNSTIKSFDSNGDLFSDTVGLFIFMTVLFGVYLYIKRRREKEQEIKK